MSHKKYREETNCLNCGATVDHKYCPECGQENVEIRDSFFHMVGHFIADYLHYDSKFFQSLRLLFTRPGFLTQQYLEGKRVRFIHPLRLFFFVTIIMVLLASLYYKKYEHQIKNENIEVVTTTDSTSTKQKLSDVDMNKLNDNAGAQNLVHIAQGFDNITHNLKYISFFLLPVYALAFSILYSRRNYYYVDHLVHTIHLQSFAYIVLSVLLLIPLYLLPSSRDWFVKVLIVITVIYMALSLKYLHRQSWGKTIVKALLAALFMFLVTVLVVSGVMIMSFIF
ncbi:DUF3667 domain-containing protein [Fulvivirgaceae bacterium PWU4]|uniref:DUF3667 domain-containing protein n=1 Tax=Chryseosolibacter histidini TaxID=2782349 RepID=A0AAP2DTV1_9BACT|nr:DUF3667 domain-containing protein [Chryseosolibacter histidini]MBT1701404.1 DUF3667 domain-containing protein [Chryseosolibacter histidini]